MKKIITLLVLCTSLLWAQADIGRAQDIHTLQQGRAFIDDWNRGVIAQEPLSLAIAYHQLAQLDTESYASEALELLEELNGPMALAYHGSVLTLMAALEEDGSPIRALRLLDEGSLEIDEAVYMDPQNIDLRLLRLLNGVEVSKSSPYQRYEAMAEDLPVVETWLHTANIDNDSKAQYLYYLGELALGLEQWDRALDYFSASMDASPQSHWAELSLDQLFFLEE